MPPALPPAPDRNPGAVRNTVRVVREQLSANPLWNFYARNGKWICPYCLGPVNKRPGKAMPDSILAHLESCRHWSRGQGQAKAESVIRSRLQYEDLIYGIDHEPAWRITDTTGAWYCPACQERIPQVRIPTGQALTSFTYQGIADHLSRCSMWIKNGPPNAAQTTCAQARATCMPQLMAYVQERLQMVLWRYADANGLWICPHCLGHIPLVRSGGTTDWSRSIECIAQHLLCRCPAYATNPAAIHIEDRIRQAATLTVAANLVPGNTPSSGSPLLQASRPKDKTTGSTPIVGATPLASWAIKTSRLTPTPTTATALPPVAMPAKSNTPARPHLTQATPPAASAVTADNHHLTWMDDAESLVPDQPDAQTQERTDMIRARDMQQNLMQRPPEIPGFRFAVRFQACKDISGDFYEFIRLTDGRVGFALGDVSGHGVQAGLIMSMAKKTFEIYAGMGLSPADTLAKVNDALIRDLGGKMFVSMVYGLLDPEQATITWARAGHNPPFHLNQAGAMNLIKPTGMVVGMKDGSIYRKTMQEEVTHLNPGDCFLLFTDGITEVMNIQQEEFGEERLQDVLRRYTNDGPDVLVQRIMDLVRHFRGPQSRSDDATLLALKVD